MALALGILIGNGLVALVTRTINDLYFVLTVNSLLISPWMLAKGFLVGVAVTLTASLAPALDAARVSPHEATGRSSMERQAHRLAPRLALVGVALAAVALGLLQLPSESLTLAFGALFQFIFGFALIVPWLLGQLSRWLAPWLARLFGNVGRLAARGVNAGLSRTGIAVAALAVAVASTVGVGAMIGSFRTTVALWLEQSLTSDVYVTLPGSDEDRRRDSLPPRLLRELAAIPGVSSLSQGRPDELRSPYGTLPALALHDPVQIAKGFRFKQARDDVWQRFRAGQAVLISESLAYHHGLEIGAALPLATAAGERDFIVGGVFYDYSTDRGMLVIDRATHADLWLDSGTTTAGVRIAPNVDYGQVLGAVRKLVATYDKPYRVIANADIRAQSMAVFDRTFTITGVLRMLAVGVALIGVLTALLALQLEKAREHATLRALGVTPGQLGVLVSLECGLMGLIAGLLALPLGWAMSELLIEVINKRSFGWSMQSLMPPGILAEALLLAIGAALLAGVYPAWRLATAPPITALREE
jgi:putative ABC transport system permease protein